MPVIYNAAELVQLKAGLPFFGVFFRLDAAPVVRLWTGVGMIEPGVNALDTVAGASYRGIGQLTDLPALQQLTNGTTQRVQFAFSKIPPDVFGDIAAQLQDQQAAIAGKAVAVGIGIMGPDWQLLGPVRWQWDGYADFLSVELAGGSSAGDPSTWSLKLNCGDWMSGRRRAGLSYWTDQDQQARSPGDRFCERTPRLTDAKKVWPVF